MVLSFFHTMDLKLATQHTIWTVLKIYESSEKHRILLNQGLNFYILNVSKLEETKINKLMIGN